MAKTNAFSTSYGLVVITKDKKTVIIQRKIPYCVQDYLMKNKSLNMNNYIDSFIKKFFPSLSFSLKLDFLCYCWGFEFEDQFDFPHGQLQIKSGLLKDIMSTMQKNSDEGKKQLKTLAYLTAVREFKEETGYSFDFHRKNIDNIKTELISFVGLDNCQYQQLYFIVHVDKLKKCKNFKRDAYYNPLIMKIEKAVKLFENQQNIKRDGKDVMLSKILNQELKK